jgi:hypothetical protein
MSLEIFNCDQGTPEWFACRMGIPTASEFATVLMQGKKKGEPSATRRKYMLTLIGERLTGQPADSYSNRHMERGKELEPEARRMYAFAADVEPQQIGFIRRDDKVGCSPDSLIGDRGMLEIKTRLPHLQIELLLDGNVPSEHEAQLQGQLWVAEREWVDFVSYWPGLDLFVKRVYRDETKIKSIELGVEMFLSEMLEVMAKLEARAA